MIVWPPGFDTALDRALFASVETQIQPPSGAVLPPLPEGRMRDVLAANGLFVQTRTAAIAVSARLAPLPPGLPYGAAREGVHLRHGPVPDALWDELRRRAVAACPHEWSGYVRVEAGRDRLIEPTVHSRSAGHVSAMSLVESYRDALVMHVHSHGAGEAYFSAQDDAADQTGGDGVYVAVVLGRCVDPTPVTMTQRRVVWRGLLPLRLL